MPSALAVVARDRPGLLRDLAAAIAEAGGDIVDVHLLTRDGFAETTLDLAGSHPGLADLLARVEGVTSATDVAGAEKVFGKRVIVIGGGAQVGMVALGAVGEADRHNLRGERISVDTIPLVGEEGLAEAVRAVARLPRARVLVLAGALMGGDVAQAVRELREAGVPVISLSMAGSVPDAADLVVSDPVQAGVMAVMAVAETARFDLARVAGRRF